MSYLSTKKRKRLWQVCIKQKHSQPHSTLLISSTPLFTACYGIKNLFSLQSLFRGSKAYVIFQNIPCSSSSPWVPLTSQYKHQAHEWL